VIAIQSITKKDCYQLEMAKNNQIFLKSLWFGKYVNIMNQKVSGLKRNGETYHNLPGFWGNLAIIDEHG
jgi:hypothetical protein